MVFPWGARKRPKPTSALPETVAVRLDLERRFRVPHRFIVLELLTLAEQAGADRLGCDVGHLDPAVSEHSFQEFGTIGLGGVIVAAALGGPRCRRQRSAGAYVHHAVFPNYVGCNDHASVAMILANFALRQTIGERRQWGSEAAPHHRHKKSSSRPAFLVHLLGCQVGHS
jgi:hypothetical protein